MAGVSGDKLKLLKQADLHLDQMTRADSISKSSMIQVGKKITQALGGDPEARGVFELLGSFTQACTEFQINEKDVPVINVKESLERLSDAVDALVKGYVIAEKATTFDFEIEGAFRHAAEEGTANDIKGLASVHAENQKLPQILGQIFLDYAKTDHQDTLQKFKDLPSDLILAGIGYADDVANNDKKEELKGQFGELGRNMEADLHISTTGVIPKEVLEGQFTKIIQVVDSTNTVHDRLTTLLPRGIQVKRAHALQQAKGEQKRAMEQIRKKITTFWDNQFQLVKTKDVPKILANIDAFVRDIGPSIKRLAT